MRKRAVIKPRLVSPQIMPILRQIGIRVDDIDSVIDAIRQKYNVHIYNSKPPFVTVRDNKNVILYGFSVKRCSLQHGWNARVFIGDSPWLTNIYEAKRKAIKIAVKWIVDHKLHESCQIKCLSNASIKKK